LCGGQGTPLYGGLRDRLSDRREEWSLASCATPDCGLVWLHPQPEPEDIGLAYGGAYYTHGTQEPPASTIRRLYHAVERGYFAAAFGYASPDVHLWQRLAGRVLGWFPVRKAAMDFRAMHLTAQPDGRLLELGCGSGRNLVLLRQLGWRVEGLDFDQSAVDVARSEGLDVRLGAIEAQKYQADSFDAVVMCHVIEHVYDPRAVVEECHRVLRPGGRLIVVTPNTTSVLHKQFGRDWYPLEPPRHITMFRRALLGKLAEESGFTIDRLATSLRGAGPNWTLSRRIRARGAADLYQPPSMGERAGAALAIWREWLVSRVSADAGEELVLVARKPARTRGAA
jgi:SAM-dependent methyltransferase